ncbi:MAG: ABC transporter ATP-binding protein [Proteobacteria bacterium]|jgi:lipoprotein-releasing system ATP-binding protein|nr:ABC transporter ATP-binding protein [Pseudomonadota bacterium]
MNNQVILECSDLHKIYTQGDNQLHILNGVSFKIKAGETIGIMGSSGSGKSTLLHVLAGLDKATSGEIILDNKRIQDLSDSQICKLRNLNLGFIYQFHHLLSEFTALENILMPLLIKGEGISKASKNLALDILGKLGLLKRQNHYPSQLSGGERQRVAIARAVINNPKIVFADEPTGNLDNQTGYQVLDIFFKLQEELHTSLVVVTHDVEVAQKTQTRYKLHNGQLTINN